MRSRTRPTLIVLLSCTAMLSTACASKATHPSAPTLLLTESDRSPAADPKKPELAVRPVAEGSPEAAERSYLLEAVIKPILAFSVLQEATTAEERLRANSLVAKVDAYNAATKPRRKRFGLF